MGIVKYIRMWMQDFHVYSLRLNGSLSSGYFDNAYLSLPNALFPSPENEQDNKGTKLKRNGKITYLDVSSSDLQKSLVE